MGVVGIVVASVVLLHFFPAVAEASHSESPADE